MFQQFAVRIRSQVAGCVQAGVQAHGFSSFQHGFSKGRLEERVPAGEGKAASGRLQEVPVACKFLQNVRGASGLSPANIGGVRVMAVPAAQAASGQEEDEADAGPVHGAAGFHGMDQARDGGGEFPPESG